MCVMAFTKKPLYKKKKTGGSRTRAQRTYYVTQGKTRRRNDSMSGMYKTLERETEQHVAYLETAATDEIGRGQFTFPLTSSGEGRFYTGVAITLTLQGPMVGDVTVDTVCFSTTYAVATAKRTTASDITLVRNLIAIRKKHI